MSVHQVTKKGNIIIDGVKYKAKNVIRAGHCDGCALEKEGRLSDFCNASPCLPFERQDGREVIFVEAKPKNPWIAVSGVVPELDLDLDTMIEWRSKANGRAITTFYDLCWAIGEPHEVTHYRLVKS